MRLRVSSYWFGIVVATFGCMLAIPSKMSAQGAGSKGNTAVYNGTTVSTIEGSPAYVDATAFKTTDDFCATLNAALVVLNTYPAGEGGTIDARGLQDSTAGSGTFMTCGINETPWLIGGVFTNIRADILLPAANICIVTPWILPAGTRLFGAGEFGPDGTVIWAASGGNPPGCSTTGHNFTDGNATSAGPAMIYMGYVGTPSGTPHYPSAPCSPTCGNVVVRDIQLVGEALPTSPPTNGIYNPNGINLSSGVEHVEFSFIPGTGLVSAIPSARYSNLSISPNGSSVADTLCASLSQPNGVSGSGTNGISGIHGLSCTAPSGAGVTEVQVTGMTADGLSINNQDMHFEGVTTDGILIGANATSQANVVVNVNGQQGVAYTTVGDCTLGNAGCSPTGGVVHLSSAQDLPGGNADVALLAITSIGCGTCGSGGLPQPTTILDDNTGDFLFNPGDPASQDTDRSVGLYVVGENFNNAPTVTSRFTTSPSWQTWGVGSGTPPTAASPVCKPGGLYSRTNASSSGPDTIYICMKPTAMGAAQWYPLM